MWKKNPLLLLAYYYINEAWDLPASIDRLSMTMINDSNISHVWRGREMKAILSPLQVTIAQNCSCQIYMQDNLIELISITHYLIS